MVKQTANGVDKEVGSRLRLRRHAIGMAQEALAEQLGISFQQVQKYEAGVNRISASRLFDIAGILHVPVSYFFEELEPSWSSGVPEHIQRVLMTAEGLSLWLAFTRLPSSHLRQRLVSIVKAMAAA